MNDKKTEKSTTQNKYDFFQTPDWEGLKGYQDWRPEIDPTIGANFGQQKNDLERSFLGATGSYQTPELREQQMRSGIENIGQNQAVATRAGQYDVNNQRGQQLGNIAGMTAPKFAQTQADTKSETKSRPGLPSIGTQLASGFLGGWAGGFGK